MVFAIVHVADIDLDQVSRALANVRTTLGLRPDHAFKHTKSSRRTQACFFSALASMPIQAHAHVMDTHAWAAQFPKRPPGNDQLCAGIIHLVMGCPVEVVARQVLFVDLPSAEERLVAVIRLALRRAMQGVRRTGFGKVRPCPDHRQHGAIIQIADMIAGEINEHSGLSGPYQSVLQS